MKITQGQITVGNKVFKSTEIDYNSYSTESGSSVVMSKTYNAFKKYGLEQEPGPTTHTICSNTTICSNSTLVKA